MITSVIANGTEAPRSNLLEVTERVPSNPGGVTGCPFAPRCEFAFECCHIESPSLFKISEGHHFACFLSDQ